MRKRNVQRRGKRKKEREIDQGRQRSKSPGGWQPPAPPPSWPGSGAGLAGKWALGGG